MDTIDERSEGRVPIADLLQSQKQIAELLEERLGPYQERAFSYTLTAWMAKKGNDKSNKAKIPEYERLALEEEQRAREERPQVIEAWGRVCLENYIGNTDELRRLCCITF